MRVARLFRFAAHGPQPCTALSHTRSTKRRRPFIRRVSQQFPDHLAIPTGFAFRTRDTLLSKAKANLSQGHSVATDPFKDSFDDARLLGDDLVVCLSTGGMFAHIAIPIGCPAQHAHRPPSRRVPFATAATFHSLGALVLGDHALHL